MHSNNLEQQVNYSQDSDMKKIGVVILMIAVLMMCVTGATFAYFAVGATDDDTITGTAAQVSLNLTVTKTLPTKTNNGVMVPQLSTTATNSGPLQSALTGGCVDTNSNIVCQVYTIVIKNESTATVVLKGNTTFYTNTALTAFNNSNLSSSPYMPNLKWKKITSTTTVGSTNTSDMAASMTASSSVFVDSVSLAPAASATYYIIVWINETGSVQTDNGTYYGKVEFASANGTGVTSTFTT